MVSDNKINIEVAYALPDHEWLIPLSVPEGTNILLAIKQSGILAQTPEFDLDNLQVGIFSKIVPLDTLLKEGDRVEIYRPLKIDPKEARRKRAQS